MKILNTKDYNKFQLLNGNRPINNKKVENLMKEAKSNLNLFPYCPIIVYAEDDIFKIIDGQHRFDASVKLKDPIYYVICDKLNLAQIARLNSNSSNWTSKDYLMCYLKNGLSDYEKIAHLIKTYKVAYSLAVDLLMVGDFKRKGVCLTHFREGTFKCNFYDETITLLENVVEVFGRYKFYNDRTLIESYRQLLQLNKFNQEVLKSKIKANPNLLDKRLSVKEYLFNIERVYNDRNSIRVSIF